MNTTADKLACSRLAEQCEQASQGSFDLNKAILSALGYTWRGMAYWSRDDTHVWPGQTRLTESVDAAMTLIPEGRILRQYMVSRYVPHTCEVAVSYAHGGWVGHSDHSFALALAAASLRAIVAA